MDDRLLSFEPPTEEPAPPTTEELLIPAITPSTFIAPWWHTAAVLLTFVIWAIVGSHRIRSYGSTPHLITYLSQTMLTWMLFGSVIAGIFARSSFFASTLRHRSHTWLVEASRGLAIYFGFLFSIGILIGIFLAATGQLPKPGTLSPQNSASQTSPASTHDSSTSTNSTAPSTTPLPPPIPETPKPATQSGPTFLRFNSKAVLALAPHTPIELLFWVFVSFSAAFCEEHIFRGYLLTQAIALMQRINAPTLLANAIAILVTSLIFGSLHLYEGIGGAVIIFFLGAVYSVVALKLGNLRAVIAAHFLQDFLAGLFLFLRYGAHTH